MGDARRDRALISYPCRWAYRVIGADETLLRAAILEIMQERPSDISLSRRSVHGNYCSLRVETTVYDADDRRAIFEALRNHPAVRVVL